MIELLHADDQEQFNTYKLCPDGKKLNSRVDGQLKRDINPWGYEGHPSLKDRAKQSTKDINIVRPLEEIITSLAARELTNMLLQLTQQSLSLSEKESL